MCGRIGWARLGAARLGKAGLERHTASRETPVDSLEAKLTEFPSLYFEATFNPRSGEGPLWPTAQGQQDPWTTRYGNLFAFCILLRIADR